MEFRNRTKEKFEWDTDDDPDGLIEPYPRSHPELATEFPGVLLEEDTPGPVAIDRNYQGITVFLSG